MVSIIVPNYNHASFLEKRITSILEQTHQDFELIILDDCSSDGSRLLIEQYRGHPKVSHIVYNDSNSGSPFAQWNKGIDLARGEFIWIAESDDYADEKLVETLLPAFDDVTVGIAYCSSYWINDIDEIKEDLSLFSQSFTVDGQEIYLKELVKRCIIQNASSALIRKIYISDYITTLHRFKYCGDWVFYGDILMRSNLWYTPLKLNYFRWYHNNTSSKAVKSGKWTDEGIHVLAFMKNVQMVSVWDIKNIVEIWNVKINELPHFSRRFWLKLQLASYAFQATLPLTPTIIEKGIRRILAK